MRLALSKVRHLNVGLPTLRLEPRQIRKEATVLHSECGGPLPYRPGPGPFGSDTEHFDYAAVMGQRRVQGVMRDSFCDVVGGHSWRKATAFEHVRVH